MARSPCHLPPATQQASYLELLFRFPWFSPSPFISFIAVATKELSARRKDGMHGWRGGGMEGGRQVSGRQWLSLQLSLRLLLSFLPLTPVSFMFLLSATTHMSV